MQKVVVPTSQKGLVEANGFPSRQLQILLSALAANSVPTTENSSTGAPLGAVILLQNAAVVPNGWTSLGTTVIGGNTYKLITQV